MWLGVMSCWQLQDFSQTCRSEYLMDYTSKYLHSSEAQINWQYSVLLNWKAWLYVKKKKHFHCLDYSDQISEYQVLFIKSAFFPRTTKNSCAYRHWDVTLGKSEKVIFVQTYLIHWEKFMHWHTFSIIILEVADSCDRSHSSHFTEGPILSIWWAQDNYELLLASLPWESKAPLSVFSPRPTLGQTHREEGKKKKSGISLWADKYHWRSLGLEKYKHNRT